MEPVCLIRCFLWAAEVSQSQEQVEALMGDLADFFIAHGFNNTPESVRSVLVAGNTEIPESAEEWIADLSGDDATNLILIPNTVGSR